MVTWIDKHSQSFLFVASWLSHKLRLAAVDYPRYCDYMASKYFQIRNLSQCVVLEPAQSVVSGTGRRGDC